MREQRFPIFQILRSMGKGPMKAEVCLPIYYICRLGLAWLVTILVAFLFFLFSN